MTDNLLFFDFISNSRYLKSSIFKLCRIALLLHGFCKLSQGRLPQLTNELILQYQLRQNKEAGVSWIGHRQGHCYLNQWLQSVFVCLIAIC